MNDKKFNSIFQTMVLVVAMSLSQLIPVLMGESVFSFMLFVSTACFLLFIGIGWAEPAASLIAGAVVPFFGMFQGVYPSIWYALTAAVANGIMVSVVSMFQKRSMLLGVLISSALRFAYCWVMVLRLIPLFSVSMGLESPSTMEILFCWPQLTASLIGGVLALPILYLLQLKRETENIKVGSYTNTK